MQEIISKITNVEQEAVKVRTDAQSSTKAAGMDAARQGREIVESAKKRSVESARTMLSEAADRAQTILAQAHTDADQKAEALSAAANAKISEASRFVMERIIEGV